LFLGLFKKSAFGWGFGFKVLKYLSRLLILFMENNILLLLILAGFLFLAFLINKKLSEVADKSKPSDELLEYLRTTNRRLDEQTKHFSQTLGESTKVLNERLDNAARVIASVQRNIGEMSEIGRSMKDLQEFLQSPKLRGNIGEQVLKEILGQFLPKSSFNLQYTFRSGEKVDAAIKTQAGIIPVDSKFPMENFRQMASSSDSKRSEFEKLFVRDVKKHIDNISKKYILTDEGTIDYALMYIPSEAVYYEVVNNQDLFDYAASKRVLPVSPTTFYAYIKAILMSFEGQKIEAQAREILSSLRAIKKDYDRVGENLNTLQKHLTNAFNMMGNVFSSFTQLGQKINLTQNLGGDKKGKLLEES
jgi:DNA recombination protein RmuC